MSLGLSDVKPHDPLNIRLSQLLNIESTLTTGERNQLANNLCLLIRKGHKAKDFEPKSLYLALARTGPRWTMYFFDRGHVVEGYACATRSEALDGLRVRVEDIVAEICEKYDDNYGRGWA